MGFKEWKVRVVARINQVKTFLKESSTWLVTQVFLFYSIPTNVQATGRWIGLVLYTVTVVFLAWIIQSIFNPPVWQTFLFSTALYIVYTFKRG